MLNDQEYIYNFQLSEDNFHRLYLDFYPSLVVFARKVLKEDVGAEDLVQDIFTRTWSARKTIPVIENVSIYLYRAVKYRCLNELRDRKNHRAIEEDVCLKDESYFETLYIEQEMIRRLNEVIQRLPLKCREILVKAMNGESNKEIACEMNITEETVKKQKQIARRFIRDKAGDLFLAFFIFCDSKEGAKSQ